MSPLRRSATKVRDHGLGPSESLADYSDLDPRIAPRALHQYQKVDVAIVAESTYPYLKGGVSAVMHDIIIGNPDLTFGILHIAWDSKGSKRDLYGMPPNVRWLQHVYLSMQEHRDDFMLLDPKSLGMRAEARLELSYRIFDALAQIPSGNYDLMWELYDAGINPRTRQYSLWPILGTKEFMMAAQDRLRGVGMPFVETFWLLREFFSLAYAILSVNVPDARVYHAHTTGYASLLGAIGARQNDSSFLLTEHNLYVRDTVNTLLDRSLALPLTKHDWREFDVPPDKRAWMAWWIEMARLSYPSAEVITYLYPDAITEAADLGAPVDKSTIVPNGMQVTEFEDLYQQRQQALVEIVQGQETKRWQLAYIARVVPIKGLYDLLGVVDMMVKRGITNFHLDVLGPTDHAPEYYELCRARTVELGLEEYVTFRGTVQVREVLGHFDLLVLPSYNEGQPIVVLEAMTAGIPVVGTDVGGMAQLITDSLVANGGETFGPCGVLVNPGDAPAMADALSRVMSDHVAYAEFARQARDRVTNFFRLDEVIEAYNRLYLELGGIALPGSVDPVVTNMVAIERLHLDARHQAAGEPIDPVLANLVIMERLLTEAGAEGAPGHEGWVAVGVLWSPSEQRWRPAGDPAMATDGPWVPLHTGPSVIDRFYEESVGVDPLTVPPIGADPLTVPPVGADLTVPPTGEDLTVDAIEQDVAERLDPDRADPIRDRLTSLGLIGDRPEPARAQPDGPPGTG
jgi:glycosyltransferase involved in cell wall biosynthesis